MFNKNTEMYELKSQLRDLSKRYKSQLDKVITALEELKQDAVYILYLPGFSHDLVKLVKQQINECKKGTKWTTPNIFITTVPLEELSMQKLEQLMKLKKEVQNEGD